MEKNYTPMEKNYILDFKLNIFSSIHILNKNYNQKQNIA